MLQIATSCSFGSWDTRDGVKDQADSDQIESPEYWLHNIFDEAAILSQNANCRNNLQELHKQIFTSFFYKQYFY